MSFAHNLWTEEEAKTKWCPMARIVTGQTKGPPGTVNPELTVLSNANRDMDNEPLTRCFGSACMMWRKHDQIGIGPDGEKRDRDMDGRTRWKDRGYCGLAGPHDCSR